MRTHSYVFLSLVSGAVAGVLSSFCITHLIPPSQESLIRDFYAVENAVHVSPHSIRKGIQEGRSDFVLVDLRSAEEYEKEHIVGAINIPAYRDKDHSDYGAVDRIVREFRTLPKEKDIIVYCYSIPCMTGRKVGQMLADKGIYVHHLGIGWNEWRHFWELWNHEHEWATTSVEDYVTSGKQPGVFTGTPVIEPCTQGQFGC